MWFVRPHNPASFNSKIRTIPMLNLSKITLLLLASIGLTACGLASLIEEIEKAGDCPLAEEFCELNEEGQQINKPDDEVVEASTLQIASSILGVVDQKSGILKSISEPSDSPNYEVGYTEVFRSLSGNGTDDGFAYFSIANTNTGTRQYVGILPGTNLGNAFHFRQSSAAEAKATWQGTLTLIEGNVVSTTDEFSIQVDFISHEISTPDGFPIPRGTNFADPRIGRLEGDFGVAGDPTTTPGQLNGSFDIDGDNLRGVPMIGLIGEQGAVGVFSGTYLGGFVASPQ